MHRYSTRPITLSFDFNPSDCDMFELVFKQGDNLIVKDKKSLTKELTAIEHLPNGMYEMQFSFSQSECGSFKADEWIYVQANILIGSLRDSTKKRMFTLEDVLKEGVIGETDA